MKKINLLKLIKFSLLIFLFLLFKGNLYSQLDVPKGDWKINKTEVVNNHSITRLEGESNKDRGITNIGYKTLSQIIVQVNNDAEQENWTEEKKAEMINKLNNTSKGGWIYLYLELTMSKSPNTKWYSIAIENKKNEEVFRKDLYYEVPQKQEGMTTWFNIDIIAVDNIIEDEFYVILIDKLGGNNKKYKFKITI